MKRKVIIRMLGAVILVSGCLGGIYAYFKFGNHTEEVEVYCMDNLLAYDGYDDSMQSGITYTGGGQSVYLDENDVVSEVLVKVGDSVSVGTPLLKLDAERLKMDLDSKKLVVEQDELNIQLATKMLTKYESAKPLGEEPTSDFEEDETTQEEVDEPDDFPEDNSDDFSEENPEENSEENPEENSEENPEDKNKISTEHILSVINTISQAIEGNGTVEAPYKFTVTGDCLVEGKLLQAIETQKAHCELYIYSDETNYFAYVCKLSSTGGKRSISEQCTWKVGELYELSDGTVTIQLNRTMPPINCSFASYVKEFDYIQDNEYLDNLDDSENDEMWGEEDFQDSDDNDNYINGDEMLDDEFDMNNEFDIDDTINENRTLDGIYTKKELDALIASKKQEIEELKITKREHELEVKKAQKKFEQATITSTVSGTVASINDPSSEERAYMVIADGTGIYMKTLVNEYNIGNCSVGDKIFITCWNELGSSEVEAIITSISPYPASGQQDSNMSYYPVIASVPAGAGIAADEYVDVRYQSSITGEGYEYTPSVLKSFVGQDEDGSYLLVMNEDNILEKKYVKTGKIVEGMYVEILSNVDTSCFIASPYLKNAKAGAKGKETELY